MNYSSPRARYTIVGPVLIQIIPSVICKYAYVM